jgi:hypothetical protein
MDALHASPTQHKNKNSPRQANPNHLFPQNCKKEQNRNWVFAPHRRDA